MNQTSDTMLFDYASRGNILKVKNCLDELKIEINSKNEEGQTILHIASYWLVNEVYYIIHLKHIYYFILSI